MGPAGQAGDGNLHRASEQPGPGFSRARPGLAPAAEAVEVPEQRPHWEPGATKTGLDLRALKVAHPFWGSRRSWADLRVVEPPPVHQEQRILRLMRQHPLLVAPDQRLNAKRTPLRSQPNASRPHEWWGIDMTTVLVQGFGWIDMGVIVKADPDRRGPGAHGMALSMCADQRSRSLDCP